MCEQIFFRGCRPLYAGSVLCPARATCHLAYLPVQIFGFLCLPYLPPCSINFHNRWLNKATHTYTLARPVSLTSHGSDLGGKSQPVYDAHTFRFMSISLFCREVLSGVSLALFELCFTYFYSLNTFSPGNAAGPNQIMAYLDLAEVKTQIAINM